jgi:hypothetical protein
VTRLRQPRLVAGFALIAGAVVVAGLGVSGVATDLSSSTPSASDPTQSSPDGTYTYLTNGNESLGDVTHAYPVTTRMTVVQTACGIRVHWNALPHRSTSWTLCRSGANVTLRAVTETYSFAGKTYRYSYACTQRALRFTCTTPHGSETGRIVVDGPTEVPVGAIDATAVQIELLATVDGATQGTETTNLWLAPHTLLPLRLTLDNRTSHSEAKAGAVQYRENATLQLVSTTPKR